MSEKLLITHTPATFMYLPGRHSVYFVSTVWYLEPFEIERCDFESNKFCGWIQDHADDFDWTLHSGQTTTGRTGPFADHTLGPHYTTGMTYQWTYYWILNQINLQIDFMICQCNKRYSVAIGNS